MSREGSSHINQTPLTRIKRNVEHCFFQWTIKDFLSECLRSRDPIATLAFSASDNEETLTRWQIDLNFYGSYNNSIHIKLTRLNSQNTSRVYVSFRWEIMDVHGNKVFPGSISTFAHPNYQISDNLIKTRHLQRDRFLADGDLHILCELSSNGGEVEDAISSKVRGSVPYGVGVMSEDTVRLFLTESYADLCDRTVDATIPCHKSILSARSEIFAEMLKAKLAGESDMDFEKLKAGVSHAILMYLYCGNVDIYLKHTIPQDLYSEEQKYVLFDLQNHLDFVYSMGLTTLESIDVTWKLPHFSILILQPKVMLYCPEPDSSSFYDNRWCFKFECNSSSDDVDISVHLKQKESSTHIAKFVVRIETFGDTAFEKMKFFMFDDDGVQGMNAFMTKQNLSGLVSFEDTLVLKCSLEVHSRR